MPRRPRTICRRPGCQRLTRTGYCDEHRDTPKQQRKETDARRRSSHARGYNRTWRRFRQQILASEPMCRACKADGSLEPATDVDHIIPVTGPDDPSFLDPEAIQPLCKSCHSRKTATQDGALGNPIKGSAR